MVTDTENQAGAVERCSTSAQHKDLAEGAGETASLIRKENSEQRPHLAPCTVKAALKLVSAWHRHLPELQGGLFAARVVDADGECLGVAIAGNPSRVWQESGKIVISRVATTGTENACSMLYGSLCRAAKALGYQEAWTYTLPEEPGTSLRAAGFMDMGMTDGGEHDRPSRRRQPAKHPEPKRRWLRRLA